MGITIEPHTKTTTMPYKKLTIPDPCQQKWNHMETFNEGRHCKSCNTTIVDFSDLSNEELIDLLQTGKYHCGRFHEDQMGIMVYMEEKRKERKKYWNSIAAAIVAGVLQVSTSFAQTDTKPQSQKLYPRSLATEKYFVEESESNPPPKVEEVKKDKVTFVFMNKKYQNLMGSVTISIKELSFSGTSNKQGEIVIELSPSIKQDQIITVEIQANVYKTKRGKRGYHGKTLFLELEKLINDEKVIYITPISGHKRSGGKHYLGRMYYR